MYRRSAEAPLGEKKGSHGFVTLRDLDSLLDIFFSRWAQFHTLSCQFSHDCKHSEWIRHGGWQRHVSPADKEHFDTTVFIGLLNHASYGSSLCLADPSAVWYVMPTNVQSSGDWGESWSLIAARRICPLGFFCSCLRLNQAVNAVNLQLGRCRSHICDWQMPRCCCFSGSADLILLLIEVGANVHFGWDSAWQGQVGIRRLHGFWCHISNQFLPTNSYPSRWNIVIHRQNYVQCLAVQWKVVVVWYLVVCENPSLEEWTFSANLGAVADLSNIQTAKQKAGQGVLSHDRHEDWQICT